MRWVERFKCSDKREHIDDIMKILSIDIGNCFADGKYQKAKIIIEFEKGKVGDV